MTSLNKNMALSAIVPLLFFSSCSDDSFVTSETAAPGSESQESQLESENVVTPQSGTVDKSLDVDVVSKKASEEIAPLPADIDVQSAMAVVEKCDTVTPMVGSAEVIFPERMIAHSVDPASVQCQWGAGGNGSELIQDVITARAEISQPIDVPAGAVLCSMEISSQQNDFVYDDHIAITFGGEDSHMIEQKEYVLISNVDSSRFFEQEGGLHVYSWEALNSPSGKKGLKGAVFDELNTGSHCPLGSPVCNLPKTQTEGALKLKLSDEVNRNLMTIGAMYNHYQLNLIITGDNDKDIDCQHKELKLNVDYTYIIP